MVRSTRRPTTTAPPPASTAHAETSRRDRAGGRRGVLSVNVWLARAAAPRSPRGYDTLPSNAARHGAPTATAAGPIATTTRKPDAHLRHTRTHLGRARGCGRQRRHHCERSHRHRRRVAPTNENRKGDVAAAEQTTVDYADGLLRSDAQRVAAVAAWAGGSGRRAHRAPERLRRPRLRPASSRSHRGRSASSGSRLAPAACTSTRAVR